MPGSWKPASIQVQSSAKYEVCSRVVLSSLAVAFSQSTTSSARVASACARLTVFIERHCGCRFGKHIALLMSHTATPSVSASVTNCQSCPTGDRQTRA